MVQGGEGVGGAADEAVKGSNTYLLDIPRVHVIVRLVMYTKSCRARPILSLLATACSMASPRWSSHALRQLQLVVPGGAITYYLDTVHHIVAALASPDPDSWGRCVLQWRPPRLPIHLHCPQDGHVISEPIPRRHRRALHLHTAHAVDP